MARMRRKSDLPFKVCPVCGRPFFWRKKWSKDWEQVIYCSDRCKREKSRPGPFEAAGNDNSR